MIEFDTEALNQQPVAKIKVVGVGGGGGNAVNSMINAQLNDIEFIVANTDMQALELSQARHKIQLGIKSTKGLGTGADPELGKRAAEEDLSKLMGLLEDADIVVLTAGMGGGTGSGALPVIASKLKEKNILTIAVLTKPFTFEGKKRAMVAQEALEQVKQNIDTLLVIPNQRLLELVDEQVSMIDAFAMINGLLTQAVKGVADIISKPGHINVDFADVKAIMKGMGLAVMGTGRAKGEDRALQAAQQAISSPLLETMDVHGARGVLINISGGLSLSLREIGIAANFVTEHADENANIILGSVIDPTLEDEVSITVIATGFSPHKQQAKKSVFAATCASEASITKTTNPTQEQAHSTPQQESTNSALTTPTPQQPFYTSSVTDLDIPTFLRQSSEPSIAEKIHSASNFTAAREHDTVRDSEDQNQTV